VAGGFGRRQLDARSITAAIEQAGGNKARAARLLGVGRATLYRKLRELDMSI
jgi:DNA-binding NtrC family response regulator